MLFEVMAIGGLGFVSALGLGIAARVFAVKIDPLVESIENALPGANCGGCGYAGCSSAATAIASRKVEANICVGGGPEIGSQIALILGVELSYREPKTALLDCTYNNDQAEQRFLYDGLTDCRAANLLAEGSKNCNIGCLGHGSCSKACPFNAITIKKGQLPKVDPDLCTGCGNCERVCPKNIIRLTSITDRILGFNQTNQCLAPCQNACPAQIDIPKYIKAISEGKFKYALQIVKEHNPLPICIGRVCPHPCEDNCRRGLNGEPININHLKRFIADQEMKSSKRYKPFILPKNDCKVAIIGGGPAGLTASYYLSRLGYKPTIFEAMPQLGGMMRYGIPQYRLPKEIMDWEIEGILDLGIESQTNMKLGKDFTLESLHKEGFEAIFIGAGAWASRSLGLDGDEYLKGVLPGTTMLIDRGLNKKTIVGENIIVIGGGNTAIDCARTCWRLNAKKVTVLYRRSKAEMPANAIEIKEAEREGINFKFLAAPTKLIGENNKLIGLEFIHMELGEPDSSGRRRPMPVKGSEEILKCDNLITAVGQFPNLTFLNNDEIGKLVKCTRWNSIQINDKTMATNIPGIFAAGDVVLGAATVVEAIGSGRKAARAIHYYLKGKENITDNWMKNNQESSYISEISDAPAPQIRVKMPELEITERKGSFEEVELGLSEIEAQTESKRCLQCGILCYKKENFLEE